MGQVVGREAMEIAIAKAKGGVGNHLVRQCNHIGQWRLR
jgi:LDH2 family malate/lactate/ureidoglycolate dehydrogenase